MQGLACSVLSTHCQELLEIDCGGARGASAARWQCRDEYRSTTAAGAAAAPDAPEPPDPPWPPPAPPGYLMAGVPDARWLSQQQNGSETTADSACLAAALVFDAECVAPQAQATVVE